MICRNCKREIPDELHFTYCGYCGDRLIRERKKKSEIRVPKARKLRSGAWNIELRSEGQSITEPTEEACIAKAKAIRAGFIASEGKQKSITLADAVDKYIAERNNVLSPSTIKGYVTLRRNRFKNVMNKDICKINWQAAINAEAKTCSPKTLENAWGLVRPAIAACGIQPPNVTLAQVVSDELPWLDYIQIKAFLHAVRGEDCEIGALLALHSLRLSELLAITPDKISGSTIHVSGSKVFDVNGTLVEKRTNKNQTSRRDIEILIPRFAELVAAYTGDSDRPFVQMHPNTFRRHINDVCRSAGLPEVGVHGLRRSFASLAYHLGWSERRTMATGGWNNINTVHKIYIKLAVADENADIAKMREYYSDI